MNICTLSPITSTSKLPVPSAKIRLIIRFGKGSTIFLHFRHWYSICYCWMVDLLQIGHAMYSFLSLISAIDTSISEYMIESV